MLYPVLSTLHRQENGLVSLTIYSNQKKVVLYVEGVLFLFQSAASGDPEFIFEDIPVAKLPLHLAGGGRKFKHFADRDEALRVGASQIFHKCFTFS